MSSLRFLPLSDVSVVSSTSIAKMCRGWCENCENVEISQPNVFCRFSLLISFPKKLYLSFFLLLKNCIENCLRGQRGHQLVQDIKTVNASSNPLLLVGLLDVNSLFNVALLDFNIYLGPKFTGNSACSP